MNNGLDIESIKASYSKLSDQELIHILSQNAHGLTNEAIQIAKEELSKRNLDPKLSDLIELQNRDYSQEELDEFCRIIIALPCPSCKETTAPLTAFIINQTMSFIFFTNYSKRLSICCPSCLKKQSNSALGTSLLLGWWGVPWGPIRTIQTISNNIRVYSISQEQNPNDLLRAFVFSNIGLLTSHKTDKEKVSLIIYNINKNKPITAGL